MYCKKIFNNLLSKSFDKVKISNKYFILVEKKHFNKYKKKFEKCRIKNYTNSWINYRTKWLFSHIHAVEYKNFVQLHNDFWNYDKCVLLFIFHIIFDSIPYSYSRLKNWKNLINEKILKYNNKF